jgi:hypothetical protein
MFFKLGNHCSSHRTFAYHCPYPYWQYDNHSSANALLSNSMSLLTSIPTISVPFVAFFIASYLAVVFRLSVDTICRNGLELKLQAKRTKDAEAPWFSALVGRFALSARRL